MIFEQQLPRLLVASPGVTDPNFSQAVVLLLEHDSNGALGFVINNKSHMTLSEVVSFEDSEIPPEVPVWHAGPVDSSAGFVLHNQKNDYYEREIAPGISLSSSQESLRKLIDNEIRKDTETSSDLYAFRLLIGYAGWGPGQLDQEIHQGTWLQAPVDRNILFNSDYQSMWKQILTSTDSGKSYSGWIPHTGEHWLH